MDRQGSTKAMVESGILTAVIVIVTLISLYVPGALVLTIFVLPAITAFIYMKHGYKYSILSLVAVLVITTGMLDIITALSFILMWGLYGVALGYCIRSKRSVTITIIVLAVTSFVSIFLNIEIFSYITGKDIISYGIETMTKSYKTISSSYIKMGMPREAVEKTMAQMPDPKLIMSLLPSMLITASIIGAFVGYFVIEKVFKRFKYIIPELKPLSQWYIPVKVALGITVIFGISFVIMITGNDSGQNYYSNAYIILVFAFTINALAFVAGFLRKRNINMVVRCIVMVFCILPPIGNIIYLLGIFDYMLDFRKLEPTRKKPIE